MPTSYAVSFNHTQLGELDMNRFDRYINGVQTPIIPICKGKPGFDCRISLLDRTDYVLGKRRTFRL